MPDRREDKDCMQRLKKCVSPLWIITIQPFWNFPAIPGVLKV